MSHPPGRPVAGTGDGQGTAARPGPATVARDGPVTAARDGPVTAGRLRAVFLGPRGGGTVRRRASDAFRQIGRASYRERG